MDADVRKTVLRMIPYGLYVLTADGGNDVGAGTINWVSQMSFDPPLLALGVKKDTKTFAQVKAGGKLGISFLGSGQGDLAFAFFADTPIEDNAFVAKENRIPFERTPGGAIVLTQAPAWAEVKLVETVETGDHAVVVVEVTDVGKREEQPQVLTLKELNLNYGG
jgi:flavin reductase (DIM6/NTAB) family NADH-FMN oxidoreductase RutF